MTELLTNEELASLLFDWDVESDNFEASLSSISAQDLADALFSEKEENRGWSDKIKMPVEYNEDISALFMTKIAECKSLLDEDKYKSLVDMVLPTQEFSVWGGSVWEPRLLPNGAILIRNHHRVIGIDETPSYSVNFDNPDKIKSDLSEIATIFEEIKDTAFDGVPSNFSIIHNTGEGIAWTTKVPSLLSKRGQTLVLISNSMFEELDKHSDKISDDNVFMDSEFRSIATSNSRSGITFYRTFDGFMYGYGSFRASDDYDTILEMHSYYLGEAPDEEGPYSRAPYPTGDYLKINSACKEFLEDNPPYLLECQDDDSDNMKSLKETLSDYYYNRFSKEKASQIGHFPGMFSANADIASPYYGEATAFAKYSNSTEKDLLVVNGGLFFIKSKDDIENLEVVLSNARYSIQEAADISDIPYEKISVFVTNKSSWGTDCLTQDDYQLFDFDSDNFSKASSELKNTLLTRLQEDEIPDDEVEDFLSDIQREYECYYVLESSTRFTPLNAHELGLRFTKSIDSGANIIIPALGFDQGYDCGDLDTGNVNSFLSNDDQSSIDLDDEDWDVDEDDDYSI